MTRKTCPRSLVLGTRQAETREAKSMSCLITCKTCKAIPFFFTMFRVCEQVGFWLCILKKNKENKKKKHVGSFQTWSVPIF